MEQFSFELWVWVHQKPPSYWLICVMKDVGDLADIVITLWHLWCLCQPSLLCDPGLVRLIFVSTRGFICLNQFIVFGKYVIVWSIHLKLLSWLWKRKHTNDMPYFWMELLFRCEDVYCDYSVAFENLGTLVVMEDRFLTNGRWGCDADRYCF